MNEIFSTDWMEAFMRAWNDESLLVDPLSQIGFSSTIGYGFSGEIDPRGVLVIDKGFCTTAGGYGGQTLNWDVRAQQAQWTLWFEKPPGMPALGLAFATGKLEFAIGDYGAMISDPRMASPFVKSFSAMARIAMTRQEQPPQTCQTS